MGNFGLDDEMETKTGEDNVVQMQDKKKRAPFAYWNVGGREYKMKLTTAVICQLEDKFKSNLLNILDVGIPPLAVMLTIIQGAMKQWEHGIRFVDVQKLFDQYTEEGGTQLTLMTDVLMPIFSVSGFFSENQQESVETKLEEMKENL